MITAIVSKKGGVGKTTTAVNLAAAVALRGKRVLLVDLDPNASASLSVGLERAHCVPGAADLLLNGVPWRETTRQTGIDGLDAIPSTIDLTSVEVELGGDSRGEHVLQRALAGVEHRYDFVFLDCPSSLGLLTRNALVAADGYLAPAVPHFLAVEGLESLVDTVERLRHRSRSQTRLVGIVPVLADYRVRNTRTSLDALRHRFGSSVFAVEVRINISLAEAPEQGMTIFEYAPRATGATAYTLLAEEFMMRAEQARKPPAEDRWGLRPVSVASRF